MAVTQAYSFADLFAFTRATAGWSFDAAGALAETAAGSVRADYDPATLAFRGLLIEGEAANSIINPRCEGAAAPSTKPTGWGFIGGPSLTATYSAPIIEAGVPCVDITISGTTSNSNGVQIVFNVAGTNGPNAAVGEQWTGSAYIRLLSGSLPGAPSINLAEYASTVYQAGSFSPITVDGVLRRQNGSRILTDPDTTTVQFGLQWAVASGVAVNFTVRVGAPQFEKQPSATSPILPAPGTPGASTRNADGLSMTSIARWFNPVAGTFVMDFMPGQAAAPADRDLLMIDDGTAANRLRLRMLPGDTTVRLGVTNGGVGSAALNAASGAALVRHTARFSYGPAGHFLSVNGAAPVSHTAAVPGGLTRVLVGNSGGANYLNGWIGPRLDYFPTQYTDTVAADGFTIRTR